LPYSFTRCRDRIFRMPTAVASSPHCFMPG
jgi:hypothetical protein